MYRRFSCLVLLASLLALSGAAAATKPISVSDGEKQMTFNAGVSPHKLPAERRAPAVAGFSLRISTPDGSRPPALRRLLLEADGHLAFDFKGVPVCPSAQVRNPSFRWHGCGRAIVGTGAAGIDNPQAHGPGAEVPQLIAYNGGVVHGARRLWLRYTGIPSVPAPLVAPLDLKEGEGHYRTKLVVSIPQVAGGSGSLTTFSLTLKKGVLAACPTERIGLRATGDFAGGSQLSARLSLSCTPR